MRTFCRSRSATRCAWSRCLLVHPARVTEDGGTVSGDRHPRVTPVKIGGNIPWHMPSMEDSHANLHPLSRFTDQGVRNAKDLARHGRIDILIANAGINHRALLDDWTLSDWDRVLGSRLITNN